MARDRLVRRRLARRTVQCGEAFVKLLQSPLVAELVAVAATAALAALAEHGFTSGGGGARGKRAGKAVKEAGKAAAAAVGRRLGTEIDEIRKAAKAKGGARSVSRARPTSRVASTIKRPAIDRIAARWSRRSSSRRARANRRRGTAATAAVPEPGA